MAVVKQSEVWLLGPEQQRVGWQAWFRAGWLVAQYLPGLLAVLLWLPAVAAADL